MAYGRGVALYMAVSRCLEKCLVWDFCRASEALCCVIRQLYLLYSLRRTSTDITRALEIMYRRHMCSHHTNSRSSRPEMSVSDS